MVGGPGRDSFDGNEPESPDEETDEVLDWEGPNMTQEPNCFRRFSQAAAVCSSRVR